jgi:hypothetical protein
MTPLRTNINPKKKYLIAFFLYSSITHQTMTLSREVNLKIYCKFFLRFHLKFNWNFNLVDSIIKKIFSSLFLGGLQKTFPRRKQNFWIFNNSWEFNSVYFPISFSLLCQFSSYSLSKGHVNRKGIIRFFYWRYYASLSILKTPQKDTLCSCSLREFFFSNFTWKGLKKRMSLNPFLLYNLPSWASVNILLIKQFHFFAYNNKEDIKSLSFLVCILFKFFFFEKYHDEFLSL